MILFSIVLLIIEFTLDKPPKHNSNFVPIFDPFRSTVHWEMSEADGMGYPRG
jgi:hypothetical protein